MLKRKMFRDIRFNLSQFITIFLMVFMGVMVYAGIRSYMDGMTKTADIFYEDNNLQDLEAIGENFTDEDLKQIKDIEHIKNAERKLTVMGTMENEEERTLQVNFIESNEISKFYVKDGKAFDKSKKGVWLDEYYAKNNNLKVGDTIKIKYEKETLEEEIIGLINVPDHVYDIKDESEIFPNHIDYGFCYLSINEFPENIIKQEIMKKMNVTDETIFNTAMPDFRAQDYLIYNYVMIDVDNEENKNNVKNQIEEKIENAIAVTDIKDSISYSSYQGEVEEGETYVGVFTGLFLFIAMLSVITTMTRVVKKQRTQIGTLKALGFKKGKITNHYVGYGLWISLLASLLGLIIGPLFIGNLFMGMEMEYFQIPNGKAVISTSSFIVAIMVVLVVSIVTYITCRKELKENPAETLRAEMPKVKQNSLNITTKGIFKKMSFSSKWNARDILRNKMRTAMGIAGITGCCMLLVCAFGMLDTMNNFIETQFEKLFNFDYKLTLKSGYSDEVFEELTKKYGDSTSQSLGIEIKEGDEKQSNNIFVDDSKESVRFLNHDGEYIKLSDNGIYVTEKLAETKGYKIGDKISWHIYGEEKYYESEIVGFDRNPQNQNIKMTKKYLENLGIEYKPDSIYTNEDLSKIKEIDGVELIQDKNALEEGMLSMINTMQTMVVLLIIVAAILGGVIIYNLGILSFTEKQYQFATLKVLGFKNKKIKKIYIKQNNWITIISIVLGLPLGFFMVDFIFKMALSDTYDFSAKIKIASYAYAIVGTYIVSFVFSKILAKKVRKIDMVTSLKGNE
ncbi:MAG: ABC transporter permease [Clostridia bacterium]|nr:ABC transporter permease [Clostridia bacterium]